LNIIIEILKEFTPQEIIKFEKFLKSPYYNQSKKLIKLYKELRKFYPTFKHEKLKDYYLYKRISPNLKFKESTFRNLIVDLRSLIDKFLITENLFESRFEKQILLLKVLINKNQYSYLNSKANKTLIDLKKDGLDSNNCYSMSVVEFSKFNSKFIHKRQKTNRDIKESLETLNKYVTHIINFFVSELVNINLRILTEAQKFNLIGDSSFVSQVTSAIDLPKISKLTQIISKDNILVDLYLHLLNAFEDFDNIQGFYNYKSCTSKYFKKLTRDEQAYHYSMLICYCIIKKTKGKSNISFDSELFGLYNTFLKEKLFIDDKSKYLDEGLFRNILILTLRLRNFEWAYEFIEQYTKFLHPEKRKNILNLSFAEYYYHLGSVTNSSDKLNLAFDYLVKIKEEAFIVKYDIKFLYLMVYYDLGLYNDLLIQLNNYRKFLLRNTLVPKERKIRFNKFLNILEKLTYLKQGDPHIDADDLNFQIINFDNFNYKNWLLDKALPFLKSSELQKIRAS